MSGVYIEGMVMPKIGASIYICHNGEVDSAIGNRQLQSNPRPRPRAIGGCGGWFDNADSYIAKRIVFDTPTVIPADKEVRNEDHQIQP